PCGTRLRQAIAFQDQDPGGVEEFGDLARERRAPRDRPLQPTAERGVQFAEDELVRDGPSDTEARGQRLAGLLVAAHFAADADGPVNDFTFRRGARLDTGEDLRVHLLEHAWHAANEVRPHFLEVVTDLVEVFGERRAQPTIDAEERLEPSERVREWEKQQVHPALFARGGRL